VLELGEGAQHAELQSRERACRLDRAIDEGDLDLEALEELEQPHEVAEVSREAIDPMDDHVVELAALDRAQQEVEPCPGKRRPDARQGRADGARALPARGAGPGARDAPEVRRLPHERETSSRSCSSHGYDSSAWTLANLYLASLGAELLGEDAPRLVGLSEETTCYVSPDYFAEDDPFADFIVHEAAHIFHNCKRATVGLRETRTKEWLLDIEYRKRETFAYSCEAYARVLERAKSPSERRALAADYGSTVRISEERVDPAEVAGIVAEAAAARNGWKVILARCAPTSRPKSALQQSARDVGERGRCSSSLIEATLRSLQRFALRRLH
jgi:hypothetical protein